MNESEKTYNQGLIDGANAEAKETWPLRNSKWLVWSFEHKGWWVGWSGYTKDINRATRFSLQEAITICESANHHLCNEAPEEAMVPDWMEGPTNRDLAERIQSQIYRGELEATDADGVTTMGDLQ